MTEADILIGIDAGTSVIKAVAFDLGGRQLAASSVPNRYHAGQDGAVTQSLQQTWDDCALALRGLGQRVADLPRRTAAISVTAQGDGTWLVGRDGPVCDAWLWLDARAAPTVARLTARQADRARFEATGTGLNTCQQGSQMAHMDAQCPELLDGAEVALHCKDWLYLNLTGIRATDPSEASFTFGDFRTRSYDDGVIAALGLTHRRKLLPPIVDGSQITHPLTVGAAEQTGLLAGTPVSLGYVDMVMTALGAGVYGGAGDVACSTVGSTGVHLRAVAAGDVHLNSAGTGYVICLPIPGIVTQVQTNMAATLNIDWALGLAAGIMSDLGHTATPRDLVARIDDWLAQSPPGQIVYHPYISEAGERGPFVNADARAGFVGLAQHHRFPDLMRAVAEGLGMAMRDCYAAMGRLPSELRLTGGAARSSALRGILSASLNAPGRVTHRDEAGAAGAAMMAAVAIGAYPDMESCIAEWVTPLLGEAEPPDPQLVAAYDRLFPAFQTSRQALSPAWAALKSTRAPTGE
ncbi:FGGY-family carbohydrate kinase [Paracoccus fistulariae]|uniref:Carbohydrate kinase n=1 Tax=Paracoccus fistulariae TaxID=658446 RepID=A0ABY7SR97_9RHOB|nr:FGGY-family carbohydrate kinase [Paracoccus fistulariae]MDB6180433.1 carbohydrate kinase [Paracoccus fistulariae]WCR08512.1 carbohydrate kinase [Paracoccus fistulariae]